MHITKNIRRITYKITMPLFLGICFSLGLFIPSFAQSITDSHLQAARKAISAIHATDQFDLFLPNVARQLKNELMQIDPNLQQKISDVVDQQALALVARRADLEREVAYAYAKTFSQDELNQIFAFYSSQTGKKLLEKSPQVIDATGTAFNIWSRAVAQDLNINVNKILNPPTNAKQPKK